MHHTSRLEETRDVESLSLEDRRDLLLCFWLLDCIKRFKRGDTLDLACFFCSSATLLSDTISTSNSSQSFWAVATVIFFASSSTDMVST